MTRVALITGAARGIGAATVRALVDDGWSVLAVDRVSDDPALPYPMARPDELTGLVAELTDLTGSPDRVAAYVADVRDTAALADAVRAAEDRWGGLDAAVAGAGVIAGGVRQWELAAAQEQAVVDVNLTGVLNLARVSLPAMLRRPAPRSGRFVAVASAAATRGMPMLTAYCAAKAGVTGLIRALAAELGDSGVTANAVSPGSTDTPILVESARLYDLPSAASFADQQPQRRLIRPAEVAAAIAFLLGPGGSAITGAIVPVDRGTGAVIPPAVAPLPVGFGIVLDADTRRLDEQWLFGGSPARALRLSPAGQKALAELTSGPVGSAAAATLAGRLVEAGLAHPVPPPLLQRPDVTVLIPVRDRTHLLRRCLSALGDDYPVVIVDDGSQDPAAIAEVASAYGVKLIERMVNGGPGAARNTGLRQIDTTYVALLDSDCVPTPGWIEVLAAHLADPSVVAVAPRVKTTEHAGAASHYARAAGGLDLGARPGGVAPGRRVAYVPTAALLVRRSALPTPGFDESLRYGEDVDLIWRLHEAGGRVRYEPSVTVFHHEPDTWPALLARRYHYGTAAAELDRRHPGAVAPLVLYPWPTGVAAFGLAGRPVLAAATFAGSVVMTTRALDRHGVPTAGVTAANGRALAQTAVGIARYATQFAAPVLGVGALLGTGNGLGRRGASGAAGPRPRRRRRRAKAVTLLIAPAVHAWVTTRPPMSLPAFVAARIADDVAYGSGVVAGSVRSHRAGAVLPAWRGRPLRIDAVRSDRRKAH